MSDLLGLFLLIGFFIVLISIYAAYRLSSLLVITNKKLRFGIIISGILLSIPILLLILVINFSSWLDPYIKIVIDATFLSNEGILGIAFFSIIVLYILLRKIIIKPMDNLGYLTSHRYSTRTSYSILYNPATILKKALTAHPWGRRIPSAYEYREWVDRTRDFPSGIAQWTVILFSYLFFLLHLSLPYFFFSDNINPREWDYNLIFIGLLPYLTTLAIINRVLFFIIDTIELVIENIKKKDFKIPEIIAFLLFNYLYMITITLIIVAPVIVSHYRAK